MATNVEQITALYVGYFGRAPEPEGLNYWVGRLDDGMTLSEIADSFSVQPESIAKYPYLASQNIASPTTFVTQIYLNLFNRAPDAEGLAYWTNELANGHDIGRFILDVIGGALTAPDTTVVANRVAVGVEFALAVADLPDFVYDAAAASAAAEVIDGVDATPESVAAARAEIADFINPGSIGGNDPDPIQHDFALTLGADTVVGTSGDDTITADDVSPLGSPVATFTPDDKIDGGAGNDTLNVTQTADITDPSNTTVSNVETANLVSDGSVLITTTAWAGLETLNITAAGLIATLTAATTAVSVTGSAAIITLDGGSDISVTNTDGDATIGFTVEATGTVTVDSTTSTATGGATFVFGGTEINVTQHATNGVGTIVTDGDVYIGGNGSTTTVSVSADKAATASATVAGHVNGTVMVMDGNAGSTTAAGTIATVSLDSYGTADIASSALTTLNLSGTGITLNIDRGSLTATPTANTLALNVSGLTTIGGINDFTAAAAEDGFTTINITSTGTASTIAGLNAADATTLNISGDAAVTLGTNVLTALTSVVSTNTAGVTLGTALGADVGFSGGTGADSIILTTGFTQTITMGAGNDTVTYGGAASAGGSVDAGEGIDTIVMTGIQAGYADNDTDFNSSFTGFEVLSIKPGSIHDDINLANVGGISKVTTVGANHLAVSNMATGGTLALTGASTAVTVGVDNAWSYDADTFNLELRNSGATSVNFGNVFANEVETVNILTIDAGTAADATATVDTLYLGAVDAKSIVVSGNNGLNLINNPPSTAVTNFDASGIVGNSDTDTAANLAVTYASANAATTADVTITGGVGNDVLTGNAAKDTLAGGAGADTLTGGAGKDAFQFVGSSSNLAAMDTITDLDLGSIDLAGQADMLAFENNVAATIVTLDEDQQDAVTAEITLDDAALAVAAIAIADGNTVQFTYGVDTYIFHNTDGNGTFDPTDLLIKVTGVIGALDTTDLSIV